MIKNIIFDIGGIITTEKQAKAFDYLNEIEQEELNKIVIFNDKFREVIKGNITTQEYKEILLKDNKKYKEEIKAWLDIKNQSITIPKNEKVINLIYKLKEKYKIYFLSDMIDITYDYLKDILEDFDGGAYSYQEHIKKPDEKFFKILISRYNLDVKETIYFDDRMKNIEAANKIGIKAIKFETIDDVINNI